MPTNDFNEKRAKQEQIDAMNGIEEAILNLQASNNKMFAENSMATQKILRDNQTKIENDPRAKVVADTLVKINESNKKATKLEIANSKKHLRKLSEMTDGIENDDVKLLLQEQIDKSESDAKQSSTLLKRGFEGIANNITDISAVAAGIFADSPIIGIMTKFAADGIKDRITAGKDADKQIDADLESELSNKLADMQNSEPNIEVESAQPPVVNFESEENDEPMFVKLAVEDQTSIIEIMNGRIQNVHDAIIGQRTGQTERNREEDVKDAKVLDALQDIASNDGSFEKVEDDKDSGMTFLGGGKGILKKVAMFAKFAAKLGIALVAAFGVVNGLINFFKTGDFLGSLKEIGNSILNIFGIDAEEIGTSLGKKVFDIVDSISRTFDEAGGAIPFIGGKLLDGLSLVGNTILEAFGIKDFVTGLGEGIGKAVFDFFSFIGDTWNSIKDGFKSAIGGLANFFGFDDPFLNEAQKRLLDQESEKEGGEAREAVRQRLIDQGIVVDEFGDDSINIADLEALVASGQISASELRLLLQSGNTGEAIDQEFEGDIARLAIQAQEREALQQQERSRIQVANQDNMTISERQAELEANESRSTGDNNIVTTTNVDNTRTSAVIMPRSASNGDPSIGRNGMVTAYD